MNRSPASIVILAWNAWETTRSCLEALAPTLEEGDQVIVVDNGSKDSTPEGLRSYPWLEVVTNETNRGFPAGCNQGAALARNDILVFLNSDTLPAGEWLSHLLACFEDTGVAAAGPRSNSVSGPQLAESASYATSTDALTSFVQEWAGANAGRIETVGRLVGFCLAVRRGAFEAIGGFDESFGIGGYEDNDLCLRLREAGWSLVIAHECFVHHEGHATFDHNEIDWRGQQAENFARFVAKHGPPLSTDQRRPLVSACLITKNEEERLAKALDSLVGLADEIVVYDTGSQDSTVSVAESHGARVIRGEWHDNFAQARNSALSHCKGEWIVWIDADEVLRGDLGAVRTMLHKDSSSEGFSVRIENLVGDGSGPPSSHQACRIFRRRIGRWRGRLHEQLWRRDAKRRLNPQDLRPSMWVEHHGYLDSLMAERDKVRRNVALARAAIDDRDADPAYSWMNLARSLYLAGEHEEALEAASEAISRHPDNLTEELAVRTCIDSLLALGRHSEALQYVRRLRRLSKTSDGPDFMEGSVLFAMENYEGALALFERVRYDSLKAEALGYASGELVMRQAICLSELGRHQEATEVMLDCIRRHGAVSTHLGNLVAACLAAGRGLRDIAEALPEPSRKQALAQALQLRPEAADALLEACWTCWGDVATLAAASTLATRLPLERSLEWSARLREHGFEGACPLVAIARDPAAPVLGRARAAAVALGAFSDPEAASLLAQVSSLLGPDELERERAALEALARRPLAPAQSKPAIVARGTSSGRKASVSIVIPCFNRADMTLRCLQSIRATTPEDAYQVVLVDNGSTDATTRLCSSEDERSFVVIRNEQNLGFAKACNQGAAAALCDLVLFLNNDTEALAGWLPPLLSALSPGVGAVGPTLLYPNGTIQHAGVALTTELPPGGFLDGVHRCVGSPPDSPSAPRGGEVDAVTGAAMVVSKEAFQEVGGFDQGFWNGNEDVDLCLKLARAGWRILYEPASRLIHHESSSGPERFTAVEENRRRLTSRWLGKLPEKTLPSWPGGELASSR